MEYPKTLSIRLKEMEKMGLIERKVLPIRIEYYPTKKGERNSFATNYRDDHKAYSRQYYSKDIFKDEKPREFKVF